MSIHGMTIAQLHKLAGEMVSAGHGRRRVAIDKVTFRHNLEGDGVTILRVQDAHMLWVPLADDDGGTAFRKDGTERGSWQLVLDGGDEP